MSYTPFKMTGKSPMMKKLIGNQHRLPEHLKAGILAAPESPSNYGSPAKVASMGSDQEKEVEDNREYVNSKTREVSSAGMERLKRNKPDASNKTAMAAWQKAYDKEFAKFKAKKMGK